LAPSRSLDERDDGGLDGWIGQLAALLEISEALLSTRELPVVLQLIASSVCHLVGVRRSAIFTYEAASDTFQGIAAHELDAAAIQAISERAADVRLAHLAIESRKPQLSEDAAADGAVPRRYVRQFGLHALGCAPLIAKDQVVGVIFLDHGGRPFQFTTQQERLLQAFGNLAAIALENARLSAAAEAGAVLRDRARIAQELHDNVAQIFFSIGLEAKTLLAGRPSTVARRRVARIQNLAGQGGTEIRNAIFALSSPPKPNGLLPSLEHLLQEYRASTANRARLTVSEGFASSLPAEIAELLYAAVREVLQNVRKHAEATAVAVSVRMQDGTLVLAVQDDGRGVAAQIEDASARGAGFGLRSLREQLAARGGSLAVSDNPEGGITVTFRVLCEEPTVD